MKQLLDLDAGTVGILRQKVLCSRSRRLISSRLDIQSALASALATKPYKLNLHPATIISLSRYCQSS